MRLTAISGLIICLCFSSVTSCNSIRYKKFNKEIWLKNSSESDLNNPRSYMTNDLIENYLKIGMEKTEIIDLLGPPKFNGISHRIRKGVIFPDSLSTLHSIGKSKAERQLALDKFNAWLKENREPDTIMDYPIGWSTIDPVSLIIRLNDQNVAYEFKIVQH